MNLPSVLIPAGPDDDFFFDPVTLAFESWLADQGLTAAAGGAPGHLEAERFLRERPDLAAHADLLLMHGAFLGPLKVEKSLRDKGESLAFGLATG